VKKTRIKSFHPSSLIPHPSSFHFALAFQNHHRQIVYALGFADEALQGVVNAVAQAGGGAPAIALGDLDQARFAETLLLAR
jgi:hypothetical protein